MSDLKTLFQQHNDAARTVLSAFDNSKKVGETKLIVATVRNRLERLSKFITECKILHKKIIATVMEVKRTSLDYFTKNRFLVLHEIYLDTSDFVAETLSRLKATGSFGTASTHPPTGRF